MRPGSGRAPVTPVLLRMLSEAARAIGAAENHQAVRAKAKALVAELNSSTRVGHRFAR